MAITFRRKIGRTYEDCYSGWLEWFKEIAESDDVIDVRQCPTSWAALVHYLGGFPRDVRHVLPEDELVGDNIMNRIEVAKQNGRLRELTEMTASVRPELIDALWKSDCQWKTTNRRHENQTNFVVANHGAFTRLEILEYDYALQKFVLEHHGHFGCVISPCAADKPYPARHHELIRERLPDASWHQVVATGVLGIVPEELWSTMPLYDSGMPNLWRCMAVASWYFAHMEYVRIVVYSDFYNRALASALAPLANTVEVVWVHSVGPRAEYMALSSPSNIALLDTALRSVSYGGRPVMMRS